MAKAANLDTTPLRLFILIILLTIFTACNNRDSSERETLQLQNNSHSDQPGPDSVHSFSYRLDFAHRNIKNKSDRKVDLLFNGIDNYLDGREYPTVRFRTECMRCLPVQAYQKGLLFGKRLLITPDSILYFKNNIEIPDSLNRVNLVSDGRKRINPIFNLQGGTGSIKFTGISCNDADFNKVRLTFAKGDIIIDSLINASVFEHDLDANGMEEQYLLGVRNCSQELVILRIREKW